MAAAQKGKALLYTCTIISTIAIVLIALNIFGIFTVPRPGGDVVPLGSVKFDWKYFLSFNVFPVLILFNLFFWTFTAVSGRMFVNRPSVRQTMLFFYALVTIALIGILLLRIV